MTKKIAFLFSILFCTVEFLHSQTGVFWFGDTTSIYVNNKIISIKENANGDLFLLGKSTDAGYKNIHPYFAVCASSGKLKSQKTIETTNEFYELNNFTICGPDRIRIWGTESVNERLTISLNTINTKGELQGTDAMMTNTTTLTGDVNQMDKENALLAKTVKSSSTGKFHISIYKYNVQTDEQSWYKTLTTDDNEEATKIFVMKDGSIILLAKLYNDDLTSFTSLIYKLSSAGDVVWKRKIESFENFYGQSISELQNKQLVYMCSEGSEKDATCNSRLIKLDSNGKASTTKSLDGIRGNGIMTLNNGTLFLFGCNYQKTGQYIISKASFEIVNSEFEKISSDQMGMFDGPDAYLPSMAMSVQPTSSDFVTAIQLSDGRIACAGRVYVPIETAPDKITLAGRSNKAFLVLMDSKGKFRN